MEVADPEPAKADVGLELVAKADAGLEEVRADKIVGRDLADKVASRRQLVPKKIVKLSTSA